MSVGVIGGSGLYEFLQDVREVVVETPYGQPSAPLSVGSVGDREVVFLPRHGRSHEFPPHKVPYRANLWALRSLGVTQVLAPCAVGSLRSDLGPGTLVIPDQLVDRTSGREHTFYDQGGVHVPFADPYCPRGRVVVRRAAAAQGWEAVDGGTTVVVEGPRFSTRAESRWFAASGFDLVNMTGHPEAVLARELEMCYTSVALVTDLDAGLVPGDSVTQNEVFEVFAQSTDRLRSVLATAVTGLPVDDECSCRTALAGVDLHGQGAAAHRI